MKADGQFNVVWKSPGEVPGDAWSDYLPGSKDIEADWVTLKCGNYNKITKKCSGQNYSNETTPGGWAVANHAAARPLGVAPAHAQSPDDASFLSTLGELREATYSDKAAIVERLGQSGHPSVRAVLTAFLEDRLYFRNSDQKIFIVKSAEGASAQPDRSADLKSRRIGLRRQPDRDRHEQPFEARTCRTTLARFCVVEPGCGGAAGRGAGNVAVAGRADRGAACASGIGVETNSGVRKEIATGLALAALDGSDRRRVSKRSLCSATASARTCGTGWRCCSVNLRRQLRRKRCEGAAGRRRRGGEHRPLAHLLFGHRDVVFWTEPRVGAGSDRHRAGHYVRRHGRHQHGARRVDDARRLHDLRGPDRRCRGHVGISILVAIPAAFISNT